jgi:predicted nucleotidyltransferase component of viral defense system
MSPASRGHHLRENIGASVRARLLNIARENKRDYNALLVQFVQERFLYRLSVSPFLKQFVLKGALLLRAYPLPSARPTKDIDFLGVGIRNDLVSLAETMRAIQRIECRDGVEFLLGDAALEEIIAQATYPGVRANLKSRIGGARVPLQIDVGFGDVVVPQPDRMDFPVLLDYPAPHLYVYPLESSVAEKFESLVKLNLLTSRMKDIYDILFMASHHPFKFRPLSDALTATFARRGTPIAARTILFDGTFAGDGERQKQWAAFSKLQGGGALGSLPATIERIRRFMDPVFGTREHESVWSPADWQWLDGSERSGTFEGKYGK